MRRPKDRGRKWKNNIVRVVHSGSSTIYRPFCTLGTVSSSLSTGVDPIYG